MAQTIRRPVATIGPTIFRKVNTFVEQGTNCSKGVQLGFKSIILAKGVYLTV